MDTPSPQQGGTSGNTRSQRRGVKRRGGGGAQAPGPKRQQRDAASSPQQQDVEHMTDPPETAPQHRTRRAAAAGVAAALQQVANQGMPVQRTTPRRAAAAGVARAAAAMCRSSPDSDDSQGVGAILLEMAAGEAASTGEPEAEPAATTMHPALAAARGHAMAAGERNRRRIAGQHKPNGEPKIFGVGDVVLLALPRGVHRGLQDNKLLCRIVNVSTYRGEPSRFTLRCNAGILSGTYTPSELSAGSVCAAELNFTDTRRQGVPVVSLPTAAAAAAEERSGKKAAPRCGCKKACGPRCPCRKAGVKCSRECKCMACRGHSCDNN